MNRSESINELATALSKAQGQMKASGKSGTNPFFKHAYATFDDILAAVKKPLADNGLSFMQLLDRDGEMSVLTTMLMHTSGQHLASSTQLTAVPSKGTNALQDFGKAITYMKRYALAAMLGVASDEDMDGNGEQKVTPPETSLETSPHWIEDAQTRKRFWVWTNEQGLTDDQVHEALGVEHVKDFDGDKAAALAQVNSWIDAQTASDN